MRGGFSDVGGDTFSLFYERTTRPFVIDPSARPPTPLPLPLLLRADLREDGHETEQLAGWIAEPAVAATDGVRLRAPVPLPLGSQAFVLRARQSAAVALWQGLVERDARWLVLDGLCGRAFSSGSTREKAWSRFGPAVWREKPGLLGTASGEPLAFELPLRRVDEGGRPLHLPTPPRSAEDGGPVKALSFEGSFSFGPFVSTHEWPRAQPETMPALMLPIPEAPRVDDRWSSAGFDAVAITGEGGAVGWMLRRDEGDGWTLVGADVADLVDPETLVEDLDRERRRCRRLARNVPRWMGRVAASAGDAVRGVERRAAARDAATLHAGGERWFPPGGIGCDEGAVGTRAGLVVSEEVRARVVWRRRSVVGEGWCGSAELHDVPTAATLASKAIK